SPLSKEVIAPDGLSVSPGFIDIHIHGAAGTDTMGGDAEGLHRIAMFLASRGVTGWMPTLVLASSEQYQIAIRGINDLIADQESELREITARVLGVHYEGPFVNSGQCGA